MTRILLLLSAVLFLSACDQDDPTASSQTSDGGIPYRLIQLPGNEFVAIQVAWGSDWAYQEGKNQATPYIGAQLLLAGGAEGYPAGQVGERMVDIGASGSLDPVSNHVFGRMVFKKKDTNEIADIAQAHLTAPTLDQQWFDRILDRLEGNIKQGQTNPAHRGFNAARWAILGDHPLRRFLSLDEPNLFGTVSRDDVVDWHQQTITASPEAVVVAGDISPQEAGAALDRIFANLPKRDVPLKRDVSPDFTPLRILLHDPEAETTSLAYIAKAPSTRDGREFEDLILTYALGHGEQSVLFDALRTELRASYTFEAGHNAYTRGHRIFYMVGEVEDAKLAQADELVRKVYGAFRQSGPDGDLEDRKKPFAHSFESLHESAFRQSNSELQFALDGFAMGTSLGTMEELQAVSEASLKARLQDGFAPADGFVVVAVSPNPDALPDACVISEPKEAINCR